MSKIVIIGAGAMGSAFALPCLDNNHDINIVGTHLENDFIDDLKKNDNLHPGLKTKIPKEINIFKFEKFDELLKSNVDLIVLGISSKGIEWVSDQICRLYKDKKAPKLLMLTKGLSIHNNNYELLVDKLERLLKSKGINEIDISAVGGPCLAAGLANRVHSSVVIANKDINTAKKIADMLNTNYYHTSFSDDLNGVEVSAAIKNIFSMAVGAAKGLCSKNISEEVREKNIIDGWTYQLDSEGNVIKDSLGNDVKIDKIVTISAKTIEFIQSKSARVLAEVRYLDSKKNIIDKFPLDSEFWFKNTYLEFWGDERVLTKRERKLSKNRFIPFPPDEILIYNYTIE